jgi:Sulfotransferase family
MFSEVASMLPTSATGPQECLLVLALAFRSMVFEGMARLPSYSEWLMACDMEPAYRYHQRVLKLLQWRCPPTSWWLRTPSHMHAIIELGQVYPDARFVMTHRDVASVLPSVAALMAMLSSPLTDELDRTYLGRHNSEVWQTALERLVSFRDNGNDHRFFDIQFGEMQSDPMGVIHRLYEWRGEEISKEAEHRMASWWDENSRDRHGSRRYGPEEFGIDVPAVRRQFRFYTDRFGVPVEAN